MAGNNWKSVAARLESRKLEERVVILAMIVMIVIYAWVLLVNDRMSADRTDIERQILIVEGQIAEQLNRQADIKSSFTQNPNAFAQTRQQELRAESQKVDERLNRLYGQLISPQQMSLMLTSILQRETRLELISLENQPSELLVSAGAASTDTAAERPVATVQIFKHGLHMVFEGDFLETVRYLRSLEQLENNFFWDNLEFEMKEYPQATISLDIYTLSTQRGWIGV